jgi:hypothetical protein
MKACSIFSFGRLDFLDVPAHRSFFPSGSYRGTSLANFTSAVPKYQNRPTSNQLFEAAGRGALGGTVSAMQAADSHKAWNSCSSSPLDSSNKEVQCESVFFR